MKLRTYPDPILRRRARPLKQIGQDERKKLHEMLEKMYENEGIGLAGPQIGWSVRVITVDPDGKGQRKRIFINPQILESSGIADAEEGCLSLPGIRSNVQRSDKVVVSAYTMEGEALKLELEGLMARVWQHEIDHLNGILFVDKITTAEKLHVREKMRSLSDSG